MKRNYFLSLIFIIIVGVLVVTSVAEAVIWVKGYYRNGTYVSPYYRTNSNNTKLDNWSTKGNINPYTGKKGTIKIK